jgi:RHS repeat-associated protein
MVGFDEVYRVATQTDAYGNRTTFGYGAEVTVVNPDGTANVYEHFERNGNPAALTDAAGQRASFTQTPRKQIAGVTDRLGGRTGFSYHPQTGRLLSVTNARGDSLRYTYTARTQSFTNPLSPADVVSFTFYDLTRVDLPDGAFETLTYDGCGNVTHYTNRTGQVWLYTYNQQGQVLGVVNPLGGTNTFTYSPNAVLLSATDPDTGTSTFGYDALFRLTAITNADGSTRLLAYDALDRLTNLVDELGRSTRLAYDAAGRLTEVTCLDGALRVTYTYHPVSGLLMRVSDSLGAGSVSFDYDAEHRLTTLQRGNGRHLTLSCDAAGRLSRLQHGDLTDLQYTLDAAGQLSQITYTVPLDPTSHLSASSNAFRYDAASQLSSASCACDRLGRVTTAAGTPLTWDGAGRLVSVANVALSYNGVGDVTTRTGNGQATRFFHHHALGLTPIVAERDERTGQTQRYYVWTPDGALLYLIEAVGTNSVRYFHFDRVGSTLALTDGAGALTDAYAYDPYGRLLARTGGSSQPFTFVGRWGLRQEGTNGFYQMRARYYDAPTARFLSREPLWPFTTKPQQINPYQYAAARPVQNVDVTGRETEEELTEEQWLWRRKPSSRCSAQWVNAYAV